MPAKVKSAGARSGKEKKIEEKTVEQREVLYPSISVVICQDGDGEGGELTVGKAKELIGWKEVEDKSYDLKDEYGKKVRLTYNVGNRPFDRSLARKWTSEILKKNWRLNGETMIIGKTGVTISAQHRLAGLILAGQLWEREPDRWPLWDREPTMPCIIVMGVDERDETVNTIDTGKPRSLLDVIYRSELFSGMRAKDRKEVSRMMAYTIRCVGQRTGVWLDAYSPQRSHSELFAFLEAHPKVLEAVKHVWEEDGDDRRIDRFLSTGIAAGMLYLMAIEKDSEKWFENPCEGNLDMGRWDLACDFFVSLAGDDKRLENVKGAITAIVDSEGSQAERTATVVKAWNLWSEKKAVGPRDLLLKYDKDQWGNRVLDECPTVGGIDRGKPTKAEKKEEEMAKNDGPDPTPDEIKKRAERIRKQRAPKTARGRQAKPGAWAKGDTAWVVDRDGDHSFGELADDPYRCDDGTVMVRVDANDGEWDVHLADLSLEYPASRSPLAPSPAKKPSHRSNPPAKHKKLGASSQKVKVGDKRWISDGDGVWRGKVVEVLGQNVKLKVENGHQGAGSVRAVRIDQLLLTQPSSH